MKTKNKIDRLQLKTSDIENKLFQAKLESNRKFNNLGWGCGMRKSKINISFAKEDRLKERLNKLKEELKQLNAQYSIDFNDAK